jgi:hypothetical protein
MGDIAVVALEWCKELCGEIVQAVEGQPSFRSTSERRCAEMLPYAGVVASDPLVGRSISHGVGRGLRDSCVGFEPRTQGPLLLDGERLECVVLDPAPQPRRGKNEHEDRRKRAIRGQILPERGEGFGASQKQCRKACADTLPDRYGKVAEQPDKGREGKPRGNLGEDGGRYVQALSKPEHERLKDVGAGEKGCQYDPDYAYEGQEVPIARFSKVLR